MYQTKETLRDDPSVSNQQGIVTKLSPKRKVTTKRTIPGGKSIMKDLDRKQLTKAFYNWLRATKDFTEVTFSLAKEPEKYSLRKQKLIDFPEGRLPVWMTHPDRRKYLADIMTDALMRNKLVKLEVNKEGMYMYQDASDSFSPLREAGDDDVSDTVAKGDMISNEDWEPNIVFAHRAR